MGRSQLWARAAGLAALIAAGLSGCDASLRPPGDAGVCFQYVTLNTGKGQFNVLETGVSSLESCASKLEGMRLHFLRLGGNRLSVTGAYQSKFIFVEPEGIFTSDSLNGASYLALIRTGDGRLAPPGAFRQ